MTSKRFTLKTFLNGNKKAVVESMTNNEAVISYPCNDNENIDSKTGKPHRGFTYWRIIFPKSA